MGSGPRRRRHGRGRPTGRGTRSSRHSTGRHIGSASNCSLPSRGSRGRDPRVCQIRHGRDRSGAHARRGPGGRRPSRSAPVRSRPQRARRTVQVCRGAGRAGDSGRSSPTTCSRSAPSSGRPARSALVSRGTGHSSSHRTSGRPQPPISKVVRSRGHGSCPLRPRQHGALPAQGDHPRDGPGSGRPHDALTARLSLLWGRLDDARKSPGQAVGDPDHCGIPTRAVR